jgi:hypothetical protein
MVTVTAELMKIAPPDSSVRRLKFEMTHSVMSWAGAAVNRTEKHSEADGWKRRNRANKTLEVCAWMRTEVDG